MLDSQLIASAFLTRMFPRPVQQSVLPPAPPRPRRPVQVIGDIHGRADLLDMLLDAIEFSGDLVFLGDIADRGPHSAQALETVFHLQSEAPDQVKCLRGNHEVMLLQFLDRPTSLGRRWLRSGGAATLESFGLPYLDDFSTNAELTQTRDRLRTKLPFGLEEWLRALPTEVRSGNVVMTHAGLDPNKPLDQQVDRARIWGCHDAMRVARNDGFWSVHGHYIVEKPVFRADFIALDTGAYESDRLTMAKIDPDGQVGFVST